MATETRRGALGMHPKERQTVSYEELSVSNMLQIQALIELLSEKGIVGQTEVLERVKRLRDEIRDRKPN
jgi:hypothetical protein